MQATTSCPSSEGAKTIQLEPAQHAAHAVAGPAVVASATRCRVLLASDLVVGRSLRVSMRNRELFPSRAHVLAVFYASGVAQFIGHVVNRAPYARPLQRLSITSLT